jgi:transposase InsO family protein
VAPAVDRLEWVFSAERPNLRWVADITEFPTGEGKLDLAAIRDLCHRGIVGWAIRHATDGSAAAK